MGGKNNKHLSIDEYMVKVARKLGFKSVEELEHYHGDLVRECYRCGDTVADCCSFCVAELN